MRSASLNASWSPANTLPAWSARPVRRRSRQPAEASTDAPYALSELNVIKIAAQATTATTSAVSRRSVASWVRTRRARLLSRTSTRSRTMAVSSATNSSLTSSQATDAMVVIEKT